MKIFQRLSFSVLVGLFIVIPGFTQELYNGLYTSMTVEDALARAKEIFPNTVIEEIADFGMVTFYAGQYEFVIAPRSDYAVYLYSGGIQHRIIHSRLSDPYPYSVFTLKNGNARYCDLVFLRGLLYSVRLFKYPVDMFYQEVSASLTSQFGSRLMRISLFPSPLYLEVWRDGDRYITHDYNPKIPTVTRLNFTPVDISNNIDNVLETARQDQAAAEAQRREQAKNLQF
jgi:hypothetical protein